MNHFLYQKCVPSATGFELAELFLAKLNQIFDVSGWIQSHDRLTWAILYILSIVMNHSAVQEDPVPSAPLNVPSATQFWKMISGAQIRHIFWLPVLFHIIQHHFDSFQIKTTFKTITKWEKNCQMCCGGDIAKISGNLLKVAHGIQLRTCWYY